MKAPGQKNDRLVAAKRREGLPPGLSDNFCLSALVASLAGADALCGQRVSPGEAGNALARCAIDALPCRREA